MHASFLQNFCMLSQRQEQAQTWLFYARNAVVWFSPICFGIRVAQVGWFHGGVHFSLSKLPCRSDSLLWKILYGRIIPTPPECLGTCHVAHHGGERGTGIANWVLTLQYAWDRFPSLEGNSALGANVMLTALEIKGMPFRGHAIVALQGSSTTCWPRETTSMGEGLAQSTDSPFMLQVGGSCQEEGPLAHTSCYFWISHTTRFCQAYTPLSAPNLHLAAPNRHIPKRRGKKNK